MDGGEFFRIKSDSQAQTGRSASVAHGLPKIDEQGLCDRAIVRNGFFAPSAGRFVLLGLNREQLHHAAVGPGEEL